MSTIAVLYPRLTNPTAMFVTVAVLPTPPFCDATEMIRAVLAKLEILAVLECLAK